MLYLVTKVTWRRACGPHPKEGKMKRKKHSFTGAVLASAAVLLLAAPPRPAAGKPSNAAPPLRVTVVSPDLSASIDKFLAFANKATGGMSMLLQMALMQGPVWKVKMLLSSQPTVAVMTVRLPDDLRLESPSVTDTVALPTINPDKMIEAILSSKTPQGMQGNNSPAVPKADKDGFIRSGKLLFKKAGGYLLVGDSKTDIAEMEKVLKSGAAIKDVPHQALIDVRIEKASLFLNALIDMAEKNSEAVRKVKKDAASKQKQHMFQLARALASQVEGARISLLLQGQAADELVIRWGVKPKAGSGLAGMFEGMSPIGTARANDLLKKVPDGAAVSISYNNVEKVGNAIGSAIAASKKVLPPTAGSKMEKILALLTKQKEVLSANSQVVFGEKTGSVTYFHPAIVAPEDVPTVVEEINALIRVIDKEIEKANKETKGKADKKLSDFVKITCTPLKKAKGYRIEAKMNLDEEIGKEAKNLKPFLKQMQRQLSYRVVYTGNDMYIIQGPIADEVASFLSGDRAKTKDASTGRWAGRLTSMAQSCSSAWVQDIIAVVKASLNMNAGGAKRIAKALENIKGSAPIFFQCKKTSYGLEVDTIVPATSIQAITGAVMSSMKGTPRSGAGMPPGGGMPCPMPAPGGMKGN